MRLTEVRSWVRAHTAGAHVIVPLLLTMVTGCANDGPAGDGDGGSGVIDGGLDVDGSCVGLHCRQVDCPGGGTTSVSGTVTTPKGDLPLYGAVVYVPQGPLDPIEVGASCEQCSAELSGNPLVQTTTDTAGKFTLGNMPVGTDMPLVIQIGKWRRLVKIPETPACTNTPLDVNVTRLPRNQSEGDIPKIALVTGGADALECLLLKVGIDQSEFTPEDQSGRINLYAGVGGSARYTGTWNGGVAFSNATALWDRLDTLKPYDIVLLSCEGTENPTNKSVEARQAVVDFTHAGGRVFASHWHNFFIEHGPAPWPTVATFKHQEDPPNLTADVDTTFPKGMALAEWLVNVGGSATLGKLPLIAVQHTVDAVNASLAQRWVFTPSNPTSVQYFTFNTPLGAAPEDQCGRVVDSDIHVSAGDQNGKDYPDGCTSVGLSPQEKALVFMLFDLSACIAPDVVK